MTDEKAVEIQEEETKKLDQTPLTPEQINVVRQHIYATVLEEYKKFLSVIQRLPIKQVHFANGFNFLDTGILWVKEGIFYGEFIMPMVPHQVPETETKPVDEVTH